MAPKKNNPKSLEEKRKEKRERERKRRAKIKSDPVKYEEAKKKEKDRRNRRKQQKKILLVNDLTPRQQRIQRKEWRERAKKSRTNKKLAERALRAIRDDTPFTDSDVEPRSISPSIIRVGSPVLRRLHEDIPQPGTPNVLRADTPVLRRLREDSLESGTPNGPRVKNPILSRLRIDSPQSCSSNMTSSGDETSDASNASRQKMYGIKRAKRQRMLARISIKKQDEVILNQKRKIKALQKKLERLMMMKQNEMPTSAKKKQHIIHDGWARRKHALTMFLEADENSMISPAVRDSITRKKVKKQKRFLCDSLENLHKKYNAQSPHRLRMSYASFCRLRPFWVVKAKLTDRDTCMCVTHENFSMMTDRLKSLKILQNDVISSSVCDTDSYQCMSRVCSKCVNKLPLIASFEDEEISYHQWRTQTEERNIRGIQKSIRRTLKARLLTTKKELVEKFVDELPKFLLHKFNIKNQHKTMTHIRENLTQGEVLVRVDFSENYACKYYKEAQSVHFGASRQQVSIHTGVFYYLSSITGKPETIAFSSVSACLRHDAPAIYAHLKKVLLHIMKDQSIQILHIASDGPSNQYKNKNNLYLFSQHLVNILNVSKASWHFSEASHGKGPADGVGAVVKETANKHVLKGNDVPDYETFVKVVKENCNVLLYEVTENDIQEGDELLRNSGKIKPLLGIKKMHQVTWNRDEPRSVNMRELTCTDCGITDYCIHYSISKHSMTQIPRVTGAGSSRQETIPVASESSQNTGTLKEGVWVLSQFEGEKNRTVLYVGQIISVHKENEEPYFVKFTRKKYHNVINGTTVFTWKEPDDQVFLSDGSIVCILPEPTPSRRGELIFKFDSLSFGYAIM